MGLPHDETNFGIGTLAALPQQVACRCGE